MRNHLLAAASILVLFATAGCKHGGNAAPTPTPTPASQPAEEGTSAAYEGSSAAASGTSAAAAEAPSPTPNPSPLQLDDARLKSWIALHNDLIKFIADERKKLAAVESKNDASAIPAAAKIGDEVDKGQADLQKKYGFTRDQDSEIQNAVNDVVGDMPLENPTMAAPLAGLKQEAAQAGPAGDGARQQLDQMKSDEKKNLDEMRLKYGPAAVGVIVAHQPELAKQESDAMNAAFGAGGK